MKKNILIMTLSSPTRDLGGPGKFVPILYQGLDNARAYNQDMAFDSLFYKMLYKAGSEIDYVKQDRKLPAKKPLAFARQMVKNSELLFSLAYMAKSCVKDAEYKAFLTKIIYNYDLLHAHDFYTTSLIPNNYKGTIIFTNHYKGSLFEEYITYGGKWCNYPLVKKYCKNIEVKAIRRADYIIFPSYGAQNLLMKDYPELAGTILNKGTIVYTGIDAFSPVVKNCDINNKNEIVFLNISNHIPAKNTMLSLKIFLKIYKLIPDRRIKYINCGAEGSETGEIKRFISEHGLQESVILKGLLSSEEMKKLYLVADFLISTPTMAVFDLVILEAMSLGLPVIATKVGGNEEALGEYYKLYYEDEKDVLSNKVVALLEDADEYKKVCGYLSARFRERFTKEKMIERYLKFYMKCLHLSLMSGSGKIIN